MANFALVNVLIPSEEDTTCISSDIVVENGLIKAVGPTGTVSLEGIDNVQRFEDQSALLVPGFYNGHTHSSEHWQRGAIKPTPLELWLCELIEYSPKDPKLIYYSSLLCAAETILSGGTSMMDHLSIIPDDSMFLCIGEAVRAYKEIGIRVFLAPLVGDLPLANSIPTPLNELPVIHPTRDTYKTDLFINTMESAIKNFHDPKEGINIAIGPTGFQLCSDALFLGLTKLANQYDLARHTHLLETKAQRMLALERFGTEGAVGHLKKIGFLTPKTSLAHSVHLDDDDIKILVETGSTPIHCPLSNLRLGSGIAPVFKYLNAGVNVAFGCDGAASEDGQDMSEAIKIGSVLSNITEPDYRKWLTPYKALSIATKGGARAVGQQHVFGSLKVGYAADMVLHDLNNLSLLPRTDPVGLLIWGRPDRTISSVWINGKQVVQHGKLITIDLEELKKNLIKLQPKHDYMPRNSQLFEMFEPKYREAMGLNKSSAE